MERTDLRLTLMAGLTTAGLAIGAQSTFIGSTTMAPTFSRVNSSRTRVKSSLPEVSAVVDIICKEALSTDAGFAFAVESPQFKIKQVHSTPIQNLSQLEKRLTWHAGMSVLAMVILIAIGLSGVAPWLLIAPLIVGCFGVMGSLGIQLNQVEEEKVNSR